MASTGRTEGGRPRAAKGRSSTSGGVPAKTAGPEEVRRTRGGWIPVGTAAERRAVHVERATPRGQQTRRQIVEAAQRVFARAGYLDAGIEDIVKEAGVSRGSFYTYFESKIDVFREVVQEVGDAVDRAVLQRPPSELGFDVVQSLHAANMRYITSFRDNAPIYALIEQLSLSGIDEALYEGRIQRRRRDTARVSDLIRRWQRAGLADPSVNPAIAASALLSMTANTCFWMFVGKDQKFDLEEAGRVVTDIWVRAVDLRRRPNRKWLAQPGED